MQIFAALYPERVRSLILIDTRAAPDTDAGRQGRDQMAAAIEKDGAGVAAEALSYLREGGPENLRELARFEVTTDRRAASRTRWTRAWACSSSESE